MENEPLGHPIVRTGRPRAGWLRLWNWKWLLILPVVILGLILLGTTRGVTHAAAPPENPVTVPVAKAQREDLFKELTLPAEFRPYVEVELHAKVSGYLEHISVDFGDKVKAGDLLATLEVPELLDELHNAAATQKKAEADYANAHLAYTRLVSVNKERPNLVAQQDLDTAEARDLTASAAIAAARAEVEKFQTLSAYTKITAPFDGIITKRYADPGALIQAGTASDTQSMPLVRLSDNYRLRMDFYVDVGLVKDVHPGDEVEVQVDSLDGRTLTARISRWTYRVEQDTRRMEAEIDVDNPKLELMPGMYATVILKVERRPNALAIPSLAVSGDKNATVYVINDQREIQVRPVTLGLETPEKYEVTSGLKPGELVVVGSRALLHPGERVEPKIIGQPAAP